MKGLLIIMAIAGGIVYFSDGFKLTTTPKATLQASNGGFVPIPPPNNAEPGKVLIMGPTCNSPNGVRTKALMGELTRLGVPYTQTNTISFSGDNVSPDQIANIDKALSGPAPLVYVKGAVKANPRATEVAARWR